MIQAFMPFALQELGLVPLPCTSQEMRVALSLTYPCLKSWHCCFLAFREEFQQVFEGDRASHPVLNASRNMKTLLPKPLRLNPLVGSH